MKKIVVLSLSLIPLFAFKCEKDRDAAPAISGKWELFHLTGIGTADYPAGNGNMYTFSGNTFKRYNNHIPADSGTYRAYPDRYQSGEPAFRIVFKNEAAGEKQFYTIKGDTLVISQDTHIADRGVASYVRIP